MMDDDWSLSNYGEDESTQRAKSGDVSIGHRLRILLNYGSEDPEEFANSAFVPPELRQERRDWAEKFTDLAVRGQNFPSLSTHDKHIVRIRSSVAEKLVEEHLWPQMQSLMESRSAPRPKPEQTPPSVKVEVKRTIPKPNGTSLPSISSNSNSRHHHSHVHK